MGVKVYVDTKNASIFARNMIVRKFYFYIYTFNFIVSNVLLFCIILKPWVSEMSDIIWLFSKKSCPGFDMSDRWYDMTMTWNWKILAPCVRIVICGSTWMSHVARNKIIDKLVNYLPSWPTMSCLIGKYFDKYLTFLCQVAGSLPSLKWNEKICRCPAFVFHFSTERLRHENLRLWLAQNLKSRIEDGSHSHDHFIPSCTSWSEKITGILNVDPFRIHYKWATWKAQIKLWESVSQKILFC